MLTTTLANGSVAVHQGMRRLATWYPDRLEAVLRRYPNDMNRASRTWSIEQELVDWLGKQGCQRVVLDMRKYRLVASYADVVLRNPRSNGMILVRDQYFVKEMIR